MAAAIDATTRRLSWWMYPGAGLGATGIYFLLPDDGKGQAVVYLVVALSSAAALAAGAHIHLPPGRRLAWHMLAAGMLLTAGAVGVATFYVVNGKTEPNPSLGDFLYLASYPFLFVGIWKLVQRLGTVQSRLAALDAAILTTAFATVQWVFVMVPLTHEGYGNVELAVLLAYPVMDLLLVAPLARSVVTASWRNQSYRLLLGAVVLLLVADEIYAFTSSTYNVGSWLNGLYMLSYIAFGASGLTPSMRQLTLADVEVEPRLGWPRIVTLGSALLAAPAILVIQTARGQSVHAYVIALGGAVASLLVLARAVVLVRAMDSLRLDEREARYFAETAHVQLAEQNAKLKELDSLKDEFVGLVSHELRTPLTSIGGYLELLDDPETGPLNDDQREFLAIAERNARRLRTLVDDLLFVARLEAGRLDLRLGDVDLAEIVSHSVDSARPRAADRGVALRIEAPRRALVRGDADRLSQLLDNLVSNALKFTLRDGSVEARLDVQDGHARIQVTDSGIGIAKDELAHLFERFYRASTAIEQQVPGTGLGLYICKAIAEAHGGSIEVESVVAVGTTFRVELPLRQRS
jgi:signal transduction histidine kinase